MTERDGQYFQDKLKEIVNRNRHIVHEIQENRVLREIDNQNAQIFRLAGEISRNFAVHNRHCHTEECDHHHNHCRCQQQHIHHNYVSHPQHPPPLYSDHRPRLNHRQRRRGFDSPQYDHHQPPPPVHSDHHSKSRHHYDTQQYHHDQHSRPLYSDHRPRSNHRQFRHHYDNQQYHHDQHSRPLYSDHRPRANHRQFRHHYDNQHSPPPRGLSNRHRRGDNHNHPHVFHANNTERPNKRKHRNYSQLQDHDLHANNTEGPNKRQRNNRPPYNSKSELPHVRADNITRPLPFQPAIHLELLPNEFSVQNLSQLQSMLYNLFLNVYVQSYNCL